MWRVAEGSDFEHAGESHGSLHQNNRRGREEAAGDDGRVGEVQRDGAVLVGEEDRAGVRLSEEAHQDVLACVQVGDRASYRLVSPRACFRLDRSISISTGRSIDRAIYE